MRARLIDESKVVFSDGTIFEYVIWEVPQPVPGSAHRFKYRFFFGLPGRRLIGYDNERGKGDHRHINGIEEPYRFIDLDTLTRDVEGDVARYRASRQGFDNPGQS